MTNKCVKFQFITDDGFNGTRQKLVSMDKKLRKSGVRIVREGGIYSVTFENGKTKQWRKDYVVAKNGGTWNDVYRKINKIQPGDYKKVRC